MEETADELAKLLNETSEKDKGILKIAFAWFLKDTLSCLIEDTL